MSTPWQVRCMENQFPGMWQRWFKHQCVAVGWYSGKGFKLHVQSEGDGNWSQARNALKNIQPGYFVVALLQGHRVGRLGEVTGKAIEDSDWNPLVPPDLEMPDGEMGRRIFVRWDLTTGPENPDLVVKLPPDFGFKYRKAISRVTSRSLDDLRRMMDDPSNWEGLLGRFGNERALSEYIASYPHRLEDGLLPYPDSKIRERVFDDRSRLDVLLIDRAGNAVIVECKQHSPSEGDVVQLRHYLNRWKQETGKSVRGVLVHGGSGHLRAEVRAAAEQEPRIVLIRYRLDVDFSPSF